jgi:hypothetical protein
MLTEKDYCDYDTCVVLEELGFSSVNNECFQSKIVSKEIPLKFFDTTLQGTSLEYAPIISLYEAQKWLREEKGIIVYPMSIGDLQHQKWYAKIEYMDFYSYPIRDTYEEALSEGIKEAVKILKEKLNEET